MNSQITNQAFAPKDIKIATEPHGVNMLHTLYRTYPHGKIPESFPVLTTGGFKPAGNISIQDNIISGMGQPAKISAICKTEDEEPVYQILLKSGREIRTSGGSAWGLGTDKNNDITQAVTTIDMYERTLTREKSGTKSQMHLSVPICRPVSFQTVHDIKTDKNPNMIRTIRKLAASNFQKPLPEEYLFSSIQDRIMILKFFTKYSLKSMTNYEIRINPAWHFDITNQLLLIIRSIGYNAYIKQKDDSHLVIRILTAQNLHQANKPARRKPSPSDFRDEILEVKLLDTKERMIAIAPEPHVYNYIVKDFCVFHATLCSFQFESREPRIPWGTTHEDQIPLRHLYV